MMGLFVFAGLVFYLAYARIRLPVSAYVGLCWIILVWLLAFFSHQVTGFVAKDEQFYATEEFAELFSNRSLWILLNQLIALFSDNVIISMRLLNLLFLCLFYIVAVRSFKAISPMPLAGCLSYASCVAALNLRDVAIYLGVLVLIVNRERVGNNIRDQLWVLYKAKFPVLFLFLLRPFQVALLFVSGLRFHVLALAVFIGIMFVQSEIGTRYFYNVAFYTQNFTEVVSDRADDKGLTSTGPTIENVAYWAARFMFAPSPLSIAGRLFFSPDTYPYGIVDLTFRTLHRFILYGVLTAILINFLNNPIIVRNVLYENSFILKFIFLYTIVYAVFNFGASHERIKFTIALMLLFLLDRILLAVRGRR